MLYRSPNHRVLRFSGPDAAAFLQSQLTNDVAALAIAAWQWQGYCSAKGRLLATFLLARIGDDRFEAIVHASTIEAMARKLTMYKLRSKLTIEIATDREVCWAFAAIDADVGSGGFPLPLADGRVYVIVASTTAMGLAIADSDLQTRWQRASINAQLPEITASTAEMFVPQMIAWDTMLPGGGVSFSKGCYPGQEIVARAHYRGAVKRHLERVSIDLPVAPAPGAEISLADTRIAQICNVAPAADVAGRYEALVVVGADA